MTLVESPGVAVAARLEVSDLEPYRRELTGYCYRMLGSGFEAEDAVQETMIKALRGASGFEGRSSVRSWLYRIATNVCIDMTRQVQRRARPMELGPASPPDESFLGPLRPEAPWVTPIADGKVIDPTGDPAELAVQKESVRLAFVAALQHLPPRQRAALVLCEVLSWSAADAAELLDTTVAAINSALQRARAALAQLPAGGKPRSLDAETADLLQRYVDAFERYDMDALVGLLHDDAYQSMPPFAMWVQGARQHHDLDGAARPVRLPGVKADRAGRGERLPGVRPVQAGSGRRPATVGHPAAGDLRREDRRDRRLPVPPGP